MLLLQGPDRGLPAPDAVIYLDLPVDVAQARGGFGEERYETVELQKMVAQQFRELSDGSWHIVDARQTVEDIHSQVGTIRPEGSACKVGSHTLKACSHVH